MALMLQRCSDRALAAVRQRSAQPCAFQQAHKHRSVRPSSNPVAVAALPPGVAKLSRNATLSSTETGMDVYINEPKPLPVGEEKRIISVFVADEPGLINRVAGVFARRGANIESMAVGLTEDKALFTIVLTGSQNTVSNLVKQLSKLVKVRYVEDITRSSRLEREMMLLKIYAPPGPQRTEVLELSQIFRAKVNDVSDSTLTLCVSGDPGKMVAIQKVMTKFGIIEVARTGRVCLKRGDQQSEPLSRQVREKGVRDVEPPMSPAAAAAALARYNKEASSSMEADVYSIDEAAEKEPGVWTLTDMILDSQRPTSGESVSDPTSVWEPHTLNIEVLDAPGTLNQVTGIFARRGYNIQSLAVGPSEKPGMSRICMVVPGTQTTIAKLLKQLSKLVVVQTITDLTKVPFVNRELVLVKVKCPPEKRGALRDLVSIFRADVLDVSPNSVIVEILGKEDKILALTKLLDEFGISEIARTGRIAIVRESGVDCKYLENMATQHVW